MMLMLGGLMACQSDGEDKGNPRSRFDYAGFLKKFHRHSDAELMSDTSNVLESDEINPFEDSLSTVLNDLAETWANDSIGMLQLHQFDSVLQASPATLNQLMADAYDSVSERELERSALPVREDAERLKFNLEAVRSLNKSNNTASVCRQDQCRVWARVNKTRQRLLLYVDGQLVDSFKVSTGDAKHETPNMSVRAAGPIFKKYTSKKFPGGDYMGLGNMPYAVFFKGGFAIHGTTPGNFVKLGKPASHGCIRLHPDDAVIFNELVRTVGLSETWVTVE